MVQTRSRPETPARRRRRLAILREAAAVFRAKGYHGAGMREIAEGLGLAPGALYYYFESKEDLLHACQDASLERLVEGARRIARSQAPADRRLRDLVAAHLDTILDVLGGSAAHVEFRALPPARLRAVVRKRDAYERLVRKVLREGVREGTFRPLDPRATAQALLGALNWTVVWWRPEGRLGSRELAEAYGELFLRGLAAGAGKEARR